MDTKMEYTRWDEVPEGLATKTFLGKGHGLKLAPGQQPVARKKAFNHRGKHVGYYMLYAVAEAVPKRMATPAQLAALEKARYMAEQLDVSCSKCSTAQPETVTRKAWIEGNYDAYVCERCEDEDEARKWAANLLAHGDFVILDTETTDLHGEIIEIAIINQDGEVLLNQRIKPQGEIAPGAQAVHGISLDDLADAPTFPEVYPLIREAIGTKPVIIYNAAYDVTCLRQDCERHNLEVIELDFACAMHWYAQWYGEWSNYWGSYKWQPLGGGHDALGDCRATLQVIRSMTE